MKTYFVSYNVINRESNKIIGNGYTIRSTETLIDKLLEEIKNDYFVFKDCNKEEYFFHVIACNVV
jgi:hypothetical protein